MCLYFFYPFISFLGYSLKCDCSHFLGRMSNPYRKQVLYYVNHHYDNGICMRMTVEDRCTKRVLHLFP